MPERTLIRGYFLFSSRFLWIFIILEWFFSLSISHSRKHTTTMFPKECKDPVTIGVYTNKYIENTPLESKIGGKPVFLMSYLSILLLQQVWLTAKPEDSRLICKYCHEPLYFVSQVWCFKTSAILPDLCPRSVWSSPIRLWLQEERVFSA